MYVSQTIQTASQPTNQPSTIIPSCSAKTRKIKSSEVAEDKVMAAEEEEEVVVVKSVVCGVVVDLTSDQWRTCSRSTDQWEPGLPVKRPMTAELGSREANERLGS